MGNNDRPRMFLSNPANQSMSILGLRPKLSSSAYTLRSWLLGILFLVEVQPIFCMFEQPVHSMIFPLQNFNKILHKYCSYILTSQSSHVLDCTLLKMSFESRCSIARMFSAWIYIQNLSNLVCVLLWLFIAKRFTRGVVLPEFCQNNAWYYVTYAEIHLMYFVNHPEKFINCYIWKFLKKGVLLITVLLSTNLGALKLRQTGN